MAQDETPGLRLYKRNGGRIEPRWIASRDARDAGFAPKTVNLSIYADDPVKLAERCQYLQGQMNYWLATKGKRTRHQDGTLGALIDLYQTHEDSPYHKLKRNTRDLYDVYLGGMKRVAGSVRLDAISGLTIQKWHRQWTAPDAPDGPPKIAAGKMASAALKSTLAFGAIANVPECLRIRQVIALLRLPSPSPRRHRPTAEQVDAIRAAAHEHDWHSMALAVALQFETTGRQWDVIGQWIGLEEPGLSDIVYGAEKWVSGFRWEMIDGNVLEFTPSKTLHRTGISVAVDLSLCPMAIEEMARIQAEERAGPIVLDDRTGRPMTYDTYQYRFGVLRKAAKWPSHLWSRDLRAGGLSEGRAADASLDDTAKLAGHSTPATTARVYDRAVLEATRRVSAARVRARTNGE